MVLAISQALSFSIFGIPMFGPDVCGFSGNSDLELCNRWMQVGAFFPFYRNHNVKGAASQEPYVWESVAAASRSAMAIRYTLLPYMYTLFAEAHSTGSTVLRALAWEFPEEPWLANADHQFLLGGSVLVTPVLTQGAETVDGVFPGSGDGTTVWYDWYNQTAVTGVSRGQNVTIDAPLGHIPVYIRGGSVIPTQKPGKTTAESRQNPWGLLVALDLQGTAQGTLYLDDGESLEPNATTWVQVRSTVTLCWELFVTLTKIIVAFCFQHLRDCAANGQLHRLCCLGQCHSPGRDRPSIRRDAQRAAGDGRLVLGRRDSGSQHHRSQHSDFQWNVEFELGAAVERV